MNTQMQVVSEPKPMDREELLRQRAILDVKADHYSRTDYVAYNDVCSKIKDIDAKLLQVYSDENDAWLAKQKQA